jgi:hypothetical protein
MPVYRKFDGGFEFFEFGDRLLVATVWRRNDEPFDALWAVAGKRGRISRCAKSAFTRLESRSATHELS